MPIIRDIQKEQQQKPWHTRIQFAYVVGALHRSISPASDDTFDNLRWNDALDVYAIVVARDDRDAMIQFANARPDIARDAHDRWTFDDSAQRVFYCVRFDGRYPINTMHGSSLMEPKKIHSVINDEQTLVRYVR